MTGRERSCMADRQRPEGRGRAHSPRRKRRLAVVACAVVACGAAVLALLASRGQKFKDIKEYKIDTFSEFPHSMELIYLAPYDADREELYAHMQQAVGSLREEVPDLHSAYIAYYEAPLLYESNATPIADGKWGPQGCLTYVSGIQPGDYSRHTFTFHVYPYDADYALTAEEWDLYQEILEYFLNEKGCQPPFIDLDDPYKHPDRVEEYRRLAERLGCSCETLMGLPNKVFLWRPSTIESLTED